MGNDQGYLGAEILENPSERFMDVLVGGRLHCCGNSICVPCGNFNNPVPVWNPLWYVSWGMITAAMVMLLVTFLAYLGKLSIKAGIPASRKSTEVRKAQYAAIDAKHWEQSVSTVAPPPAPKTIPEPKETTAPVYGGGEHGNLRRPVGRP